MPEARPVLVFSWFNHWPIRWHSSEGGGLGHTLGQPAVKPGGGHDFLAWLAENGIGADDVRDMGLASTEAMAKVMRLSDVAIFPNR